MSTPTRHILLLVALLYTTLSYAQQAPRYLFGGGGSRIPDTNAVAEFRSTGKGLLIPRIPLTATASPAPLGNHVAGMLIYNTATAGDVTPGFYFNDGARWVRTLDAAATDSTYWRLGGNAGTDPSGHFLGTIDSTDLSLRTNNAERMRISANGKVGIGTASPATTLHVNGQLRLDTVLAGNVQTDSLLVQSITDNTVKRVSASAFVQPPQQSLNTVATNGQTIFTTPANITDVNKILLYRNGVLISFTQSGINTIIAEIACSSGDEIRIIQFL